MVLVLISSFFVLMLPELIDWFSFATTEGKVLIICFPLLFLIILAMGHSKK